MDLDLFHVEEDVRKEAYTLYEKTEESAKEDVDKIKNWMKTQPHLPEIMEDAKIRNFLFLNKFNIEKAQQKIDMYYTVRGLFNDFFDNSNPKLPEMQQFMDSVHLCVLPKALNGINRVFIIKVNEGNTFGPRDLVVHSTNVTEPRLSEDCLAAGEILIFDMMNISISDLKKLTPSTIGKILVIFQKVYSIRSEAIYILNSSSFISSLVSILKSTLKPKIFERVRFYENTDVLHEILPKDQVPFDYGGEGPSLKDLNELVRAKLSSYQERFDKLDVLRTNENLRAEKLNKDEILGFFGHFVKVNVD